MAPTFKAGLLATALASVALLPAAGIMTIASVEAAHAKGGNGNGNGGNGNGNGGRGSEAQGAQGDTKGGGRPEWAGSRGNGNNAARTSGRGGSDPISNFIRGLGGQEKREAREDARAANRAARLAPTTSAPQISIAPPKRPARNSDLHPSDLGNMNGAMNASINAVLAHIRNGNTNGPVGQMAAFAVAGTAAADADQFLASSETHDYQFLQAIIERENYSNLQDYRDSGESNDAIDAALLAWETFDETIYDKVIAAGEAEDDLLAAQESILAYWNKNPDSDPTISEDLEQPLLEALMLRFDGHETEIKQAIADAETRAAEEDLEAACEDAEGCDAQETEALVATAD